ncbi:3'-5' RNA helicase YTHDC2-like [Hydractinia symbiolongicarpus]|uniref:3'-5' RNA helicase YTHDC2-like n=1 Tax=Hydractinia symbiolongicarpus TaxID=13093 RepID=UPI00254C4A68|nr:3'-5' RNA helicase YTHDC2-like [Hydractinia symbiolongicarpus]
MAERKGGGKGKEKSKVANERSGKTLSKQDICVGEELKIAVTLAVDRFRGNEDEKELEFPSSLTANERAYVHRYCQDLGLISKSRGKGNKRYLTVYKVKEESAIVKCKLSITKSSSSTINSLLSNFPVTNRDRHELSGQKLHKGIINEQSKILARENRLVLGNGPHVPPEAVEGNEFSAAAQSLPIYHQKEEILNVIEENQVVLIAGETGSGKTTQVGKFILEKHHLTKQPCRVICTQPRRLSAMSVSERVAAERGEKVGETVGYQVRLDSKLSPSTLLQFCTNGVLLRLLMVGHKCLSNITHIIVDEIHERDVFSDYLMISLRDLLKTYKKLKVILMSATLNIDLFKKYFGSCQFIHIPGKCYEVKSYFLEDVLKQTGYVTKGMRKLLQENDIQLFQDAMNGLDLARKDQNEVNSKIKENALSKSEEKAKTVEEGSDMEIESENESNSPPKEGTVSDTDTREVTDLNEKLENIDETIDIKDKCSNEINDKLAKDNDVPQDDKLTDAVIDSEEVEAYNDDKEDEEDDILIDDVEVEEMSKEMDSCLAQAWLSGDDEAFDQIIHLIMNENVLIDYQHSETKMTALIVAAARGNLTLTEQLVEFGAQIDIQDPKNKRDALGWAHHFGQNHVAVYLQSLMSEQNDESADTSAETVDDELDENDKRRLELYHKSFDDQRVDLGLIMSLLSYICKKSSSLQGAILIFLPGYDEIVSLRDCLSDDKEFSKRSKYQILLLHSMISTSNQRKVFAIPPKGVRKIILSTNIAETSITIKDVVYVIDSGKVKEKSHDAVSSISTLRTVWVSKASAIQRRGRAGRCASGFCYHLFSQDRFHHLQTYQDAEILRVPIHDLCLQTKMLAPVNVPISDYLAKAPEPPSNLMIRNSIRVLKSISALDENEDMTDLGKLLVEISIEPQLGKMVFMGLSLKCLEPAIIIACCSAYKEPFLLPTVASQKSYAASSKLRLSSDSHSDQIAMLRAFQGWQHARKDGREKSYCSRHFISPGTMEMVHGMRQQILTRLRSLGLIRSHGAGDIKDLNRNSKNWAVIKAVVGAGLYPNLVKVDRENSVLVSEKEKKVTIHNSSVIMARNEDKVQSTVSRANKLKSIVSSLPFDWLTYEELSRLYYSVQIRSVSVLSPVAVALLGGQCLSYEHSSLRLKSGRDREGKRNERNRDNFFQESDSEQEDSNDENTSFFKIDDWITFSADDMTLNSVAMLRVKFLALFTKHIQIPAKSWSEADDAIVQCIVNILTKEEQAVGLTNPATRDVEKKISNESRPDRYLSHYDSYSHSRGGYSRGYRQEASSRGRRRYPPRQQRRRHFSDEKSSDNDDAGSEEIGEQKRRSKRFFILKCNNDRNMTISFERNIWATTKNNEKKLDRAFRESDSVYLIFSVQGSGHFQGVAKMKTNISNRFCDDFGSSNLGGVFDVEWISKEDIAFQHTQHLTNPWNDNKKVQISRDAQEVEPSVGEQLCKLWEHMRDIPKEPMARSPSVSPVNSPIKEKEENQFYTGTEIYDENEASYMEGYQLYSPPPFSPQYMPEFQHVPPHYAPPPPPMYQQPYPVYAATGGMPAYRPDYYQLQYPPQRNGDTGVYARDGQYQGIRPDSQNRSNYGT